MIKVVDLYKSFGDLEVLKGINNEINKGEVVCVIGPSGSGKSTFCAASTCWKNLQAVKYILTEYLLPSIKGYKQAEAESRNGISAV